MQSIHMCHTLRGIETILRNSTELVFLLPPFSQPAFKHILNVLKSYFKLSVSPCIQTDFECFLKSYFKLSVSPCIQAHFECFLKSYFKLSVSPCIQTDFPMF